VPAGPPTVSSLRAALAARQLSAVEVARESLDRLSSLNPRLNAFLDTFPDQALAQAAESDRRLASGDARPLEGIPVALKDNLCLAAGWQREHGGGGRTTAASRILEHYRSPFTATAAQRLIDAGAVVVGKTNLDEFAMGSSGEHSAFGPTRNPFDPEFVPGGSSSGSAAAVAAGIVPAALGSDTGGSIRQPASFCDLVGVKPTYGRVSRYGLVAYASSLDQVGPMARTVADAAILLNALCGPDPLDSTSLDLPREDFAADLDHEVLNPVLGVPRQARSPANDPAVARALDDAVATFRALGATVLDVDLPHLDHAVAAYYIIAPAEASSNLARYDGIRFGRRAATPPAPTGHGPHPAPPIDPLLDLYGRSRAEGFGPEVQRRIMLGTHVLSAGYYDAYYLTALRVRRLIKRDFDAVFEPSPRQPVPCHAVLMPVAPTPPFRLGEKTGDPMALYLEDIYTTPANLAGLPAVAFPVRRAAGAGATLPIGAQLIGPPLAESLLLRLARMFEAARGAPSR
jgi:aspartyl-tRNA(Asn)/glutamyl-tRNA(Gln) amidotransferase subunit A